MQPPQNMSKVIHGFRYSVETATLIASDCFWDGQNFERSGTNSFLYRTNNGAYFLVYLTQWQGARDTLTPVSTDDAVSMYTGIENDHGVNLCEHDVAFDVAFPDVTIRDA